jgi:rhodanese-related sulfurtransferase
MLIDRGFTLVRPLAGGLEAWAEAGYPVEAEPLISIR